MLSEESDLAVDHLGPGDEGILRGDETIVVCTLGVSVGTTTSAAVVFPCPAIEAY